MSIRQIVESVASLLLVGITLVVAVARDTTQSAAVFVATLATVGAYQLFATGILGEFTLSALATKVQFIRNKRQEAESLVNDIQAIRDKVAAMEIDIAAAVTPTKISLVRCEAERDGDAFKAAMVFTRSKPESIGPVVIMVAPVEENSLKIRGNRSRLGELILC